MPNGLNVPEHPHYVSWGGFFEWKLTDDKKTFAYTNNPNSEANKISRKYSEYFYPAIFNNFAARTDWAKEGKGNKNQVVIINGKKGME